MNISEGSRIHQRHKNAQTVRTITEHDVMWNTHQD
jgi:hypothetical protein